MNSAPSSAAHRHFPWAIWNNPIFRRYCQSRLRLRDTGIALLITVLIAGFIVAMTTSFGVRSAMHATDAARNGLIPLLTIQGLILFVLGTAQVAGGMTAERDEGVIDYQRLLPLTPLTKVVGYLFGLPVREWLMFWITMPFTAWCLWRGQVGWHVWLPLYVALFSSALLYHLTGLVTGTVVRNRRWAFLISIGLVFCLYTIIPQAARFGLVFFKYLTITPVFRESFPGLLPVSTEAVVRAAQRLLPSVRFFNLDFSEVVFTLFSQGGLILTFVVMLCRRWRRAESHLLGKLWATGLFIWIQILLLGNALPLIDPGDLHPAPIDAVMMSGLYGIATLVLIYVLGGIITPSGDHQLQGWRRARKQDRTALPLVADAASASGFTLVMALTGGAGWFWFTRALVESRWFPGQTLAMPVLGYFLAVMVAGGLGFQLLLEWKGGRVVGLLAILVGGVPLMAGAVLSVFSERMYPLGAWLVGISPASLPFYASGSLLPIAELPESVARAVPRAFDFWLLVSCLVTIWLGKCLWQRRQEIARRVMAKELAGPLDPR